MSQSVLPAYGLENDLLQMESFGSGLINSTWKITTRRSEYILQRVNNSVFKQPSAIAHNIRMIADYLRRNSPDYFFIAPLNSTAGDEMIYLEKEGFFRLFPFVPDSHSKDTVESPDHAFEAALQFGRFTRLLADFNVKDLKITIPHFHNLVLRQQQFEEALKNGNQWRVRKARRTIDRLNHYTGIVNKFIDIQSDPRFLQRVTHHDTKISNVLFNSAGKALCVIDLDTVMPGYFISDLGDMMRTYLCPVTEEETDFSLIEVRDEYYKAIVEGYFSEMHDQLTAAEKQAVFYAGSFMIYMQGIRFLTDYLNNDLYYGARYVGHNLNRAKNQFVLLERLLKKEKILA
jgi:Ser/Thr protein kinase RdoA (MazF antagonist)